MSLLILGFSRGRHFCFTLLGVFGGGGSHPGTIVMSCSSSPHAVSIARPVAFDHVVEFSPIDWSEIVMSNTRVPPQSRIRDLQSQIVCLRGGLIYETLAQFVISKQLYFPALRLRCVWGFSVRRTKHHPGRPPPTI